VFGYNRDADAKSSREQKSPSDAYAEQYQGDQGCQLDEGGNDIQVDTEFFEQQVQAPCSYS
jgi:hypothetical protein